MNLQAVSTGPAAGARADPRRVEAFRQSDEEDLDVSLGREIGYEFARLGMRLPEESALALREGYAERTGQAAAPSTRWERKLVRLRASAWRRNRLVDPNVTAQYLEAIQVSYCPITRCELTSGTGTESDATIDRVFNGGAYAVGNLAVMSMKANQAKANLMPLEIVRVALSGSTEEGLSNLEWMRLAALVSASVHPDYMDKPLQPLPLLVYPPNGLLISNGYVVLQQSFSALAVGWIREKWVKEFRIACAGKKRKHAFDDFMVALTYAIGRTTRGVSSPELYRFRIADAWAEAIVFELYVALMSGASKEEVGTMISVAQRAQDSLRSVEKESLRAWSVETHGYAK